jgi:1-acyl-sn-glycerol-3-phosphate acyltransferase
MIYRFCRRLAMLVAPLFFRFRIKGLENVPLTGGALLCSNHISNLDPPIVALFVPRHVKFMAKQELFRIPVLSQLISLLGAYPVKRGGADKSSIKKSLQLLETGHIILIFPEGTRSKTGELGKGRPGVGFLALRSGVPVIPVFIQTKYRFFDTVNITYGEPLYYREPDLTSQQVSDDIMSAISALKNEGMK